jgi:hypothetical protein
LTEWPSLARRLIAGTLATPVSSVNRERADRPAAGPARFRWGGRRLNKDLTVLASILYGRGDRMGKGLAAKAAAADLELTEAVHI